MEMIINDLYNTILKRKTSNESGSYTKYLLDKGTDKILKKFGEEAIETIIACKEEDKQEQVNELCDLIYHMLVLMVDKDIKLEDLEVELKERRKTVSNFKGERRVVEEL